MIIDNRPDEEQAGQPSGADIHKAARAAGIDYSAIPITDGGYSVSPVNAMRDALTKAQSPVLAFRATLAWALAQGANGEDAETQGLKAADASYQISPVRAFMTPRRHASDQA